MPGIGRALRPLTKPPVIKDFLTYDMEWFPGTQVLRVICVYDGNRARHYFTAKAFIENEFVPANSGKRFYAHAGGLYDVAYLLQHLVMETKHPITAAFSASSAVVVSVKVGGHKFMLCDSLFLLRSSLASIAKWTGERKGTDLEGDEDPEQTRLEKFHAPIEELIDYCKSDCMILWKALRMTQLGLYELGCEMKVTAASTAMGFFRSRFLGEVIPTSDAVNRVAREAYKASRVEIVMPHAEKHWCYDFNSSFPYSMTFPQPGRLIKTQWRYLPKPGVIYLAEVKVSVPVTHLPAVPYSKDGRVYFPTGTWGPTWMSSVDIELLQEAGGEILEVGRVLIFESQSWLSDYVHLLYDMRKNETDPFRRELLKILLNSCYGKFAENEEKTQLLIHPQKTTCPHKPPCERFNPDTGGYDDNACMEMLFPGAFLMTKRKPVHHVWVPISMHITALSRELLWNGMQGCHEAGYEVAYCDSVTGDRTVVVRDPDRMTRILPIEDLWSLAAAKEERPDGKETSPLPGWCALARDANGTEGWFEIATILRHRTSKTTWRIATSRGQTEVTEDHGIMVGGVATAPADFVANGKRFEKVRACKSREIEIVDLWPLLRGFKVSRAYRGRTMVRSFFLEDGSVYIGGWGSSERGIPRYLKTDSEEFSALLRLIGAYVSEGSSSIPEDSLAKVSKKGRFLWSIAQKGRTWLEGLERDLSTLYPDSGAKILPVGGDMFALRSGGSFLASFFAALCGKGSRKKKLPPFCFDLSAEKAEILWSKMVEGDGHVEKATGARNYASISPVLTAGVSYLLDQHGKEHSIHYREDKVCWTVRERPVGSERKSRVMRVETKKRNGEWVYDLCVPGAQTFVDGIGRVLLHNTDSIYTNAPPKSEDNPNGVPTGNELGQLKLDPPRRYESLDFIAPKVYVGQLEPTGDPEKDKRKIKAKGFPGLDDEMFDLLKGGYDIGFRSAKRVRGLFRSQNLTPRDEVTYKGLVGSVRPKRCPMLGNRTRPWDVSELEEEE